MGSWYFVWKVNTRNRRWIWKSSLHTISLGQGISCKVRVLEYNWKGVGVLMETCGVTIGSIKWIDWRRGLRRGIGSILKLLYLRDLEEQIGEEEGGLKPSYGDGKPQRGWGLEYLGIPAYLCICKFKKHCNLNYMQVSIFRNIYFLGHC